MTKIYNRILINRFPPGIYFLFFLIVIPGFITTLRAQEGNEGTIRGMVIDDSTNHPLQFVNAVLHKKADSTIVTGEVTDQTGKFHFTAVSTGEYFITFNLIGYVEKHTPDFVIDAQHKHLNVGEVRLLPTEVFLDEVLVRGEKSLYSASIDRKVYNVDADLMSKSGSASEILQNVPSVQVDIDGTVSLRGSSNVLIMINGKTSPLMNKNSATVLESMPASSLEKIEVITNPSAKYKPDGTAGIINIVLKKNTSPGINGNIAANAGNQDRYNSNLRLNYNPGAFNIYGSYGIRRDSRNRINNDDRSETDSVNNLTYYEENLKSYARPLAQIASLGFEYRIDHENQFGITGDYFYNKFTRTENSDKLTQNSSYIPTDQYRRDRLDYEFEKEYSLKTFFEHNFPKEDHTLRLEFSTSRAPETEDNHYTNHYFVPPKTSEFDNTLINNTDKNSELTLEYSNPLTDKSHLEAGYTGELMSSDLNYYADFFDANQHRFTIDTLKTNRFLHDEAINSVYLTYKQSLGALGLLAGVRTEHAFVKSNLVTLNSTVTNSYFSWYPTLHLSYELTKLSELQFSYSRRTRRPEAEELNPFPEYRDPRNVTVGNPKLLPEYIHSIELGYQFQNEQISILPALFYRYTYNRFTSLTEAVNDTLWRTTRQNLSNDKSGGLEIVVSANFSELIALHMNANAFLNQIDASNLGYTNKKSTTTWSGSFTLDLNMSRNSRIQINSNYNSSRLTPQGKYSPSYVLNLGFRQKLFEDKFSLILTAADLFKTLKREFKLDIPSLKQTVINRRDSKIFYFGLTYYFGVQQKKSKEEQLRYDDNL